MALPFSSATGGVPVAFRYEIGHVAAGFAGAVQYRSRGHGLPLQFVQQRFVGLRVFDLLEMPRPWQVPGGRARRFASMAA